MSGVQLAFGTVGTIFATGICGVIWKLDLWYIARHSPNTNSKKHGGNLVANVLKSHGVKHVFTLCGGHISPILVACEQLGIRIVDTRHEVSAAFAADAMSRLSGKIGVVAVTAGPGLTNTITAVKNAQMAESSILVLGGAAATALKGRGSLQDINQMALFKPICKYSATVSKVRDIVPTLKKAIKISQSGSPGPVFVELPVDTLYPYEMVAREIGSAGRVKSLQQRIVGLYMTYYLSNLFSGAFETDDYCPLDVDIPYADETQIKAVAKLLNGASKPVIVIGSQATLPPTPIDGVIEALRTMNVPCYLGGMARGLLGANCPFQMKQQRRDALKEADVIILAGAICDFRLNYGKSLSSSAKIISINRDGAQVKMNSDLFWKPTICCPSDPADFLIRLSKWAKSVDREPWFETLANRETAKEASIALMSETVPDQFVNPMKVFVELEKLLPSNGLLIADGGDFVATASYMLRPRGHHAWLDPGPFGTLGVGGGFALGAKLARPDLEVWIIYGDGSFGYSLSEFDSFIRHKTPVIALIGNDGCWSQIAREQVPMFGSDVGCNIERIDYHLTVKGFRANGFVVKETEEVNGVLQQARDSVNIDKTAACVNVFISKSDFRKGSISL